MSKHACPVCGDTSEKVYYCTHCQQYWCLALQCPTAPDVVKYVNGKYEENALDRCPTCGERAKEVK